MTPQQFHTALAWQRLIIAGIYTVPFGLTLWGTTVPGFIGWAMIIVLLLWNFAMVGNALAMLWQTEALQSAASATERRVEALNAENGRLWQDASLVDLLREERSELQAELAQLRGAVRQMPLPFQAAWPTQGAALS